MSRRRGNGLNIENNFPIDVLRSIRHSRSLLCLFRERTDPSTWWSVQLCVGPGAGHGFLDESGYPPYCVLGS